MTLIVAWHREDAGELIVASDSRLSGVLTFESGPKLFALARGDAVLAFAGATYLAYPLIMQITRWAVDHDRANSRAMDLPAFAGHCERLCSDLLQDTVRR